MNISEKELQKEKKYLEKVKNITSKNIDEIETKLKKEKKKIYETKKYIWEECNALSELEIGGIFRDANAQVTRANEQAMKAFRYKKMLENPYFGRIDFKSDDELINVYIGLNGLSNTQINYIFDWRAPISSLFYDYTIGKAKYEAPMGKIEGDITLRRQYKIENGQLKRVIESDINIDDDILQEVLSSNSSEKMKNIVTTIQKEQNQVIRNTTDRYLIVQGVAGSGKTSAALHRIAYLLYKEENLKYNNILIFSPNDVFSEYISDVLPELGEENVLNTTFNDIVKTYLKKQKNIENFSSFLERTYENIEYINTSFYEKKDLDLFIKSFLNNCIFKKGTTINGIYFNQFELNELLTSKYKKFPFLERINQIAEYICNNARLSVKKSKNRIVNWALKETNIELDPITIYSHFLETKGIKRDLNKKVYYEDLVGIIYIYFEINSYPYNTNVKHVVVDEGQDYSKLQYYILKKIFPYAYFTILGDINQSINPYCKYKSLEELKEIFSEKSKYIELNKTYRSSSEIINFANKILNIKNIDSARGNIGLDVLIRNNEKYLENIINDIRLMKKNNLKTIAIIAKNRKEVRKLYSELTKENTNISFVKDNISLNSVSILPSYIAKGLEFDGVIVYNDNNNSYSNDEKNLYYVVCTRAQHQLIIYNN